MQFSQLTDTASTIAKRLVRLDFKGLQRLIRVNSLFHPEKIVWNFSNMDQLFATRVLANPAKHPSPIETNLSPIPDNYAYNGQQKPIATYKTERRVKSFIICKNNQIIHEDYRLNTKPDDLHISWSMSKSITSLLLGALIDKNLIPVEALEYQLIDHLPELEGSGYDGVTLRNVLNMASGVAFNEDYMDYHSDINRMGRVIGMGGRLDDFAASLNREWPPGTYMHYVSIDTHVIGMMIRALTKCDIGKLLDEHIFSPLGLENSCYILTDGVDEPFVLGGLNMSSRDYARIGLMALNHGRWNNKQIISSDWLNRSTTQSAPEPDPATLLTGDGQFGYGMQWWIPCEAEEGEFFGIGIYSQFLYINRKSNIVIVQNAADIDFRTGNGVVALETLSLFRQIAHAV